MKHLSFIYALVLFFKLSGISQTTDYSLRKLTVNDGLSQSSVININQDKLGQMWFATRDGLNTYDGKSFKVYRNIPKYLKSISNSDILSIEEDSEGNIWIGTYNGLNKFDPVKKEFTHYFHKNNKQSICDNTIWCIKEINDEIWVGTSKGLSVYNKKKGIFNNVFHSLNNRNSLSDNFVTKIIIDQKSNIWIGTSNGLNKLNDRSNNKFTFEHYKLNTGNSPFFIQDLLPDSNSNIWIATKQDGLFRLDKDSNKLINFPVSSYNLNSSNDIRALCFDNEENLWVGTYDGITILNKNGSFANLKDLSPEFSGLEKIKSIFLDKKGSIWIGSYYGGISIWDPSYKNFTSIHEESSKGRLSYNVVGSLASDQKELIYFGTEGGGVTIFNIKTGNTEFLNKQTVNGLSSENIKSLHLFNENELWIGTFTKGIEIVDLRNKTLIKSKIPDELQKVLTLAGIYSIKQESEDILWIGTFGKGAIRYNNRNKQFRLFEKKVGHPSSLSNNRVRAIYPDSSKRVWMATQSGLNCINLNDIDNSNFSVKHYFYNESLNSGTDILCIFEDKLKRIWVGTKGNGLFRLNGSEFEKINIKTANGLSSIHAIVEDKEQNLWLSTNQGIIKYSSHQNSFVVYDQSDGLISNEFNDNSAINFKNEQFFFGGPSGGTYFNPLQIITNKYSPQVFITDFLIQNEIVNPNDKHSILTKNITYTDKITLAYDKANFTIRFAIPNFINSSKNVYAYRLKGLDKKFTVTKKNEASYTIQNPGTYIFEVKGANNNTVWNKEITSLVIKVKPAPWRSPLAFIIYALLIITALITLIQFLKSKAELKHKLELELKENERIEEINQSKLQFFTNISHEFRTPLTLILGPLEQLLTNYSGSNQMYKKLLVIQNSAKQLLHLINRLMDFRKLENKQFNLQSAEGNIVKFIKEIYFSFGEFAKSGNYTYTFNSEEDPIKVYYDRDKLERVFYNIISNAFKYTPKGGQILIEVKKNQDKISISISDNGIGISEEYIDKIFDRFFEIPKYNNNSNEPYNKGTGIGLAIAKNIVKLHSGDIFVKNNKKAGTTFEVVLPLGKEHLHENEILKDFKPSEELSQYTTQLEINPSIINDHIEDIVQDEDKIKLLVVEDNEPLRSFIKNLLKPEYFIIEAENGKIGMQKAIQNNPDLIISDVLMPEMVGTELCAKIKADLRTCHIPVILLTARTSLIYKFEGLESGADDYISKPFNVKEFKLKIKNLLDSVQRIKEKFSAQDSFAPNEITVSSLDEELLKKAFKIVEENIGNELFDIPQFCSDLGISRTMLFTKIKAWTNFTPNEFIQEIRLKRAAQLLEQNKINISQICYKVGFKNPKYFSKCFQKKYGSTPTQYQNKFS